MPTKIEIKGLQTCERRRQIGDLKPQLTKSKHKRRRRECEARRQDKLYEAALSTRTQLSYTKKLVYNYGHHPNVDKTQINKPHIDETQNIAAN